MIYKLLVLIQMIWCLPRILEANALETRQETATLAESFTNHMMLVFYTNQEFKNTNDIFFDVHKLVTSNLLQEQSDFKMVEINCTNEPESCQNIHDIPSVKLYMDGIEKETYKNDLQAEKVFSFLLDWMIYDNRDFVMPKMKDMQLEDISDPKVSVESVSDQLGDSVIRIPSKEGESKSNKKTHHHSHKSAGEPIRTHKENSAKSNHDQIDDKEKSETDTHQITTVSVDHSTPDEQHVSLYNVESVVTDQPNTEELLGSNPQELNVDANNDTNSLNKDVSEPIDSNAPGSGPLTTENTNVKLKTIENENYENVNQSSTTDSLIWPYLFFGGFFLVTFSLIVHKRRFYRYKLVELEKEEF